MVNFFALADLFVYLTVTIESAGTYEAPILSRPILIFSGCEIVVESKTHLKGYKNAAVVYEFVGLLRT